MQEVWSECLQERRAEGKGGSYREPLGRAQDRGRKASRGLSLPTSLPNVESGHPQTHAGMQGGAGHAQKAGSRNTAQGDQGSGEKYCKR